jgi:hypothetical protein
MDANSVITEINAPLVKGATAITAAAAVHTDTVTNTATLVASTLVKTNADPGIFWFIVSVPWAGIASLLAALYTGALLSEWIWKKALKPLLIATNLMKPAVRRVLTAEEVKNLVIETDSAPL